MLNRTSRRALAGHGKPSATHRQAELTLREQARSHRTGVSQKSARTWPSAAANRAATFVVTATTASMPTAMTATARPPERPAAGHG